MSSCLVTAELTDEETGRWNMQFCWALGGGRFLQFDVERPYLHSLEEWRRLAAGCQDSQIGGWNGHLRVRGTDLEFLLCSLDGEGAGVVFKAPREDVETPLNAVLDAAAAQGWNFV